MRRLARFLFTALAAGSLAACLAVCVLWARSYWVRDVLMLHERDSDYHGSTFRASVTSDSGAILAKWRSDRREETTLVWFRAPAEGLPLESERWWERLGFRYRAIPLQEAYQSGSARHAVTFPHASCVILLSCLPAWSVGRRVVFSRRQRRGLCPSCGYDLRATPGRCPECGTAAATGGAVD